MQEPWKTDKWFISSWNYLPEATKGYNFATEHQDSRRHPA